MADFWLAGEGALWWQPDGPNTKPQYLGLHLLGNVDESLGDITLLFNPDSTGRNKWKVVGAFQKEPSPVKTSIKTDIQSLQELLESTKFPGTLYVLHNFGGRKNVFGIFDRMFVLEQSWTTKKQYDKTYAKEPKEQDRAVATYDISSNLMQRVFKMVGTRLTISDNEDGLDIYNASLDQMATPTGGDADHSGDKLYLGTSCISGSAGSLAQAYKSTDKGSSWSATVTPFTAGQKIQCIKTVDINDTVKRILAGCGTTDPSNPAKIAYSDDGGTTWTKSSIGTTLALYFAGPKAMLAVDYYHVWAALSDGSIWMSADGGQTWACKSTGLGAQAMTQIVFSDERYGWAVGKTNTIYKTIDGGSTWSLVSGPSTESAADVMGVYVHNPTRVWFGYNDGTLWYTRDGGNSFTQRVFCGGTPTAVTSMDWADEYIGMVAYTLGGVGYVALTWDGGYTWENVSVGANTGINSLIMVNTTLAYAVGSVYSGSAWVCKIAGG